MGWLRSARMQRSRSVFRLVAFILRAVVVVLSMQFAGVASAMTGWLGVDELGQTECCSDCPSEKMGHECPPECPDCHCAHGGVALMPFRFEDEAKLAVEPFGSFVEAPPYEATAPRAPPLRGLYRPPRS